MYTRGGADIVVSFQPFLRFWRRLKSCSDAVFRSAVSTLLEILVGIAVLITFIGLVYVVFQPFLRFWRMSYYYMTQGKGVTEFQPFLRFWSCRASAARVGAP